MNKIDSVGSGNDYTDPKSGNTPTTVPDLTHPIDSGIDPTTSIPKTNPTINPGVNPIDNVNTSSIKDLICINIANAEDDEDEDKKPCDELKRDRDAAKEASETLEGIRGREAQKAYENIDNAYNKCCLNTRLADKLD